MKDLWDQFGLKPNSSVEEIDLAYLKLRSQAKPNHSSLRLHWKILRDPYASLAYNQYRDIRAIIEAGFFDDEVEPEDTKPERNNLNWLTTPIQKIKDNLVNLDQEVINHFQKEPPIILLSTGAFSPIHQGHLMMMENAKKELEKRGRIVLGGYFSPSHDQYVFHKYQDAQFLDTPHRLHLCERAIVDNNWLMIDSWEARYNDVPITYTDVLIRLESYLQKHLAFDFPLQVFYVFGGDNAAFARLFIQKGGCVCVKRPIHEDRLLSINHDNLITNNNNILLVDAFFDQPSISSTEIRHGLKPGLESINDLLQQWQFPDTNSKKDLTEYNYIIRDDSSWATQIWSSKHPAADLTLASSDFIDSLGQSLSRLFSACVLPDTPKKIFPIKVSLHEQQGYVNDLCHQTPIINLDLCTHSDRKLNISRLFNLCDGQVRSLTMISRPSSESIPKQFNQIKKGDYTVVDDDIATGFTTNQVVKLAPSGISIVNKVGLTQVYLEKHRRLVNPNGRRQFLDIIDFRDFLVGSQGSGLVVSLPTGEVCRAPYVLPYVSLVSRAMIPPSMELDVSLQVWQLNLTFHQTLKSKIILEDCDPSFQKLMYYIGFSSHSILVDICKWHLDHLKSLAFK